VLLNWDPSVAGRAFAGGMVPLTGGKSATVFTNESKMSDPTWSSRQASRPDRRGASVRRPGEAEAVEPLEDSRAPWRWRRPPRPTSR
jgi:hypothetical protein